MAVSKLTTESYRQHSVIVMVLVSGILSSVVAQTCPSYTAGYTGPHSDSLHDSSSERIYFNEASAHRAPCDGTVYAWYYCYYDAKRTTNLEVAFGAYRAVLDEGEVDRYTLRSGSYYLLHLDSREMNFTCDNVTLEESEYFQIYQDDRVGACLKDNGNVRFLDILAEDAPDDFIVGRSDSGSGQCRESDMSDLSDLSGAASGMVLHLYVDINVDECVLDEDNCHETLATCTDVVGGENSFTCTCMTGYTGNGVTCTILTDVNECIEGTHTCHTQAYCTDTVEGYSCTCNSGYTGSGEECSEIIVQCTPGLDDCGDSATCTEFPDGHRCVCNSGFTGDGITCTEIIVQCTPGLDDCGDSATCMEFPDGHRCVCNSEFTGNGVTCTDNGGGTADGSSGSSSGLSGGAVAAIVIVLLLVLAVGSTAAALVGVFLYRRRMEPKQTASATSFDNKIYHKQCEEASEGPTAYEVPVPQSVLQSLPQESVYEMSNQFSNSETVYELAETNIYAIPDLPSQSGTQDATFIELPPDYADLYEQTVAAENIYESASPYQVPAQEEEGLYEQISSYHIKVIPRREIQLTTHLGSGQFGSVSKGVWRHGNRQDDVAVKTLTDSANTVKFLQEAAIMAQFRHPNILTLHGVVSAGDQKMIIVELMHNGDLKEHLTNMRPDPGQLVMESVPVQLLNFSKQVALGLHYLACRGFVHRDLAARNILVSNKLCKIADFGMSRDLADDDIYVSHGGMIPIRWTAPEAFSQKKYSTASDVWSFGCVLYEIWSLGHKPFETTEVRQVPSLVKKGYRLPPPPGCPQKIYELMIQTWHPDASSRPQPKDILRALLRNVDEVMAVPAEDVPEDNQAAVLGAPLHTSTQLYPHLQNTYM